MSEVVVAEHVILRIKPVLEPSDGAGLGDRSPWSLAIPTTPSPSWEVRPPVCCRSMTLPWTTTL